MNRIDRLFSRLRADGRKALMPFVTAGDPDLETTLALIVEMLRRGSDGSCSKHCDVEAET